MRRCSLRLAARVAVLAAIVLGGTAGLAKADNAATRDARALDLFEKSEAAYDSGRFADAIALLRQSYELKKEPVLLYNMGRAYEGLGDPAAAAQSYEAFLRAQPQTPDRGALERRVATLRRQVAEREALQRQARQRETPQARGPNPVPWVVAGVGVLGIGAGAGLGMLAGGRNDEAKSEPTYVESDRLHSEAESFATGANIAFITGGVLLVGGVIWGLIDLSAANERARITSGGRSLTFSF